MIPPRILITARNDQFPRITLGYAVDGTALTARVDGTPCPDCQGAGEVETWDGNPGHRSETERCEMCQGDGVIE